uniref:Ubiquitin-like-conjugating enzyme ATG10 n=1 Tax=Ditylum brightwellii TaxID=49249 RepID=A0A7S4SVK3_9STRA
MRKMKKCEFDQEVRALSSAFATLVSKGLESNGDNNNMASLIFWRLEEVDDPHYRGRSRIFLSHPPCLCRYDDGSMERSDFNISDITTTAEEEENLIELDEASLSHISQSVLNDNMSMVEWIVNVCYSDVWSVPVMYFRCQRIDGTTLTRSEVLHALQYSESSGDSWDFVSEEEHPILGIPSFFLHPCQTSLLLNLLEDGLGDGKCAPGCLLLSWLSMVLPAIQYRITSEQFACLQKYLT